MVADGADRRLRRCGLFVVGDAGVGADLARCLGVAQLGDGHPVADREEPCFPAALGCGDGPFPSDADDVYGGLGIVRVLLDTFVAEGNLEQRALLLAVPDGELADGHGRVQDAADRDVAVVPEVDENARARFEAEEWRRPAFAAVGVDVPPLARIVPPGNVVFEQDVIVGAVPISRRPLELGPSCTFPGCPIGCPAGEGGSMACWARSYRKWRGVANCSVVAAPSRVNLISRAGS